MPNFSSSIQRPSQRNERGYASSPQQWTFARDNRPSLRGLLPAMAFCALNDWGFSKFLVFCRVGLCNAPELDPSSAHSQISEIDIPFQWKMRSVGACTSVKVESVKKSLRHMQQTVIENKKPTSPTL